MSTTLKSIVVLMFIFSSNIAVADTMTLASAQKQVDEYRALRKVCTVSILERKQECFKDLVELTQKYKDAKRFLVINAPVNEEVFVGFAQ